MKASEAQAQYETERVAIIKSLADQRQIIERQLADARKTLVDLRAEERSSRYLPEKRKGAIANQKLSLEAAIGAFTGELQAHAQREAAARLGHVPELQMSRVRIDATAASESMQAHRDAEAAFDAATTPELMQAVEGLRALGGEAARQKVHAAFGL